MTQKILKSLLISDFNTENLAGYLSNDPENPAVTAIGAPFGQVYQPLMDANHACWQDNPDLAIIWTRPDGIIEAFQRRLNFHKVSIEQILEEVDEHAAFITGIMDRVRYAFVPTWVLPPSNRGYGMLDMRHTGVANTLMQMNLRLAERLEVVSNIFVLNADRWMTVAGKHAFNPKLWYMAKVAFGNAVFKEAVVDFKAAIRGMRGQAKKLIVLDLDDTLWGGTVGEVGWQNLILGGHDPVGEAFVDFQQALKALTNRGIILGIVSKNHEAVAFEAIRSHPEMALGLDDFAGWKINWQDKAQNISDLAYELNLGLQSVVFIDDNPVERGRVKEALPEVFVPDWPDDKKAYRTWLQSLTCFDTSSLSQEDAVRTKMYTAERERISIKQQVGSLDEWLTTLSITVNVAELNPDNLPRTIQLLNKTNQMNLSTRRMTDEELLIWLESNLRKLWTFRVSDRFGDSGLTGIISLDIAEGHAKIVDFILSCRVMGRKVEEAMLTTAIAYAQSMGLDEVYAEYRPTAKNKPCLEFWERSGFSRDIGRTVFRWQTGENYPIPPQIKIESGTDYA